MSNAMIRTSLPLILVAAACSADVALDLNGSPPETPSAPVPLPDPSLGELDWAFTDPGLVGADTRHLERAADGSVIAAGRFLRFDNGLPGSHAFLARLSRDGAPMWLTEFGNQDLVDLAGGFSGMVVEGAYAFITSIDSFDDGRILVALNLEAGLLTPKLEYFHTEVGVLRWYDSDGNLLETHLFPDEDEIASLPERTFPRTQVTSVLAFPDGGGVHARLTRDSATGTRAHISRFDADGDDVWTTVVDGSAFVADLTVTPDGGLLFHSAAPDPVTVGDPTVCAPAVGPFVARLELDDGRCSWVTSFKGANHLLVRGGIGVAAGGNVVAVGGYSDRVRAGELELEAADERDIYFVSELGPDGDVRRLSAIEPRPPADAPVNDRYLEAASVGDGKILTSGLITDFNSLEEAARPAFIAIFDLDGQLLTERRLEAGEGEGSGGIASRVTIVPDGGVLAGGFWVQQIDFGDGQVVETARPDVGQLFVARYHPVDDGTVDRVTR